MSAVHCLQACARSWLGEGPFPLLNRRHGWRPELSQTRHESLARVGPTRWRRFGSGSSSLVLQWRSSRLFWLLVGWETLLVSHRIGVQSFGIQVQFITERKER